MDSPFIELEMAFHSPRIIELRQVFLPHASEEAPRCVFHSLCHFDGCLQPPSSHANDRRQFMISPFSENILAHESPSTVPDQVVDSYQATDNQYETQSNLQAPRCTAG